MAFRNPPVAADLLAQLPDGAIPGSKLSADTFTGRTFTGGTFQTALPAPDSPVPPAGANLREATDANGDPYGLLEFTDGIYADASSYIMGKADYNPRSVAATTGGGITLQAGRYNGQDGPSLSVKVETDGAGYVRPAARVSVPFEPVATDPASFIAPPFVNDPFTGNEQLTVYRLSSGLCFLAGILQHTGATAISAANAQIASVPVAYAPPTGSTFLQGFFANAGGTVTCYLSPNGGIFLAGGSPPIPAGSFLVFHSVYRTDVPKHA